MALLAPSLTVASELDWQINTIDPYKAREQAISKLNASIDGAGGFVRLKEDAEKGDGYSSFVLGDMYRLGIIYDVDFDEANKHFNDAVALNEPNALLRKGQYLMGHDPLMPIREHQTHLREKDLKAAYLKGFDMIERSAYLGNTDAMYFLGLHYIEGEIKFRDRDIGMFWLSKSYSNGNEKAGQARDQYMRQADYDNDFDHIHRMATYGDTSSMVKLADFYLNDWKVEKNKRKALRLLRTAAKLGDHDAVERLKSFR